MNVGHLLSQQAATTAAFGKRQVRGFRRKIHRTSVDIDASKCRQSETLIMVSCICSLKPFIAAASHLKRKFHLPKLSFGAGESG